MFSLERSKMKKMLLWKLYELRHFIDKLYTWLKRILQICTGLLFLVTLLSTVVLPSFPLLITFYILKRMEKLFYQTFYGAKVIVTNGTTTQDRIILMVLNSNISVSDLRELFIRNVLDLHRMDGELEFPNVTKSIRKGYLNQYWTEENFFDISEHIQAVGSDNNEYTVQDIPKLLSNMQKEKYTNSKGCYLSPWLIKTAPLTGNRCAVMFKINVALKEVEILRALLASINGGYERKNCKKKCYLTNDGMIKIISHIAMVGWTLFSKLFNTATFRPLAKRRNSKEDNKRVYFCSKRLSATSFQQIGRFCGVSSRYVVLANLGLVLEELLPNSQSFCLTNFENGVNTHEILINLGNKPDSKLKKGNLLAFIKYLRSKAYLDPSPSEMIYQTITSKICLSFVPTVGLPYVTSFLSEGTSAEVKVDMNAFELEPNARLLGRCIQSLSVWNEQNEKDEVLKVTVNDCMDSLVIGTVSHQNKEELAMKILKRFYEIHCDLVKQMNLDKKAR